jgi:CheY-like chemotaxis protein
MNKRAFVLDDDEILRELLRQVLEGRGYEVLGFSNPGLCPLYNEGSCRCTDGEACGDIIISDINMPRVSGLDFIERQKKMGCKVKNVALMSGAWSGTDVEKAKSLGCKVFQKPFSLAEIEKWLDECENEIDPERILTDWFKENLVREQEAVSNQSL